MRATSRQAACACCSIDTIKSDSLLQTQDLSTAAAVTKGLPLRKRKREPRLLKCQAIISAANNSRPVPGAPQRKKLRGPAVKASKAHKQQLARVCNKPDARKQGNDAMDLWGDKMVATAAQPAHKQPGGDDRSVDGSWLDRHRCPIIYTQHNTCRVDEASS